LLSVMLKNEVYGLVHKLTKIQFFNIPLEFD